MLLTEEELGEVVSALRNARSTLSALRVARRHRDVLFAIRLECEAYLSNRTMQTRLQPERLVNALALYYYRSGRPDQARTILRALAALPYQDLAWQSQTLVNLLRIDSKTGDSRAAESAFALANFLLMHGNSLINISPTVIEAYQAQQCTLLHVQALPLLTYIFRVGEAVEIRTLQCVLPLLIKYPGFSDTDGLYLAHSLQESVAHAPSISIRPRLSDFDTAKACPNRLFSDADLLALKRATVERTFFKLS